MNMKLGVFILLRSKQAWHFVVFLACFCAAFTGPVFEKARADSPDARIDEVIKGAAQLRVHFKEVHDLYNSEVQRLISEADGLLKIENAEEFKHKDILFTSHLLELESKLITDIMNLGFHLKPTERWAKVEKYDPPSRQFNPIVSLRDLQRYVFFGRLAVTATQATERNAEQEQAMMNRKHYLDHLDSSLEKDVRRFAENAALLASLEIKLDDLSQHLRILRALPNGRQKLGFIRTRLNFFLNPGSSPRAMINLPTEIKESLSKNWVHSATTWLPETETFRKWEKQLSSTRDYPLQLDYLYSADEKVPTLSAKLLGVGYERYVTAARQAQWPVHHGDTADIKMSEVTLFALFKYHQRLVELRNEGKVDSDVLATWEGATLRPALGALFSNYRNRASVDTFTSRRHRSLLQDYWLELVRGTEFRNFIQKSGTCSAIVEERPWG